MSKSREHIYRVCLAPELRVGLIKFQAEKELGEVYALLLLITKALYLEQKISREAYEFFSRRYSRKLVMPTKEDINGNVEEQQKLQETRRWFVGVKAEFFKDHRPLASGKSWRDYVLGEAEKYKDLLPEAVEVLKLDHRALLEKKDPRKDSYRLK